MNNTHSQRTRSSLMNNLTLFAFLALLSIWLALPIAHGQETSSGSYTITVAPAPLTLTPASGALVGATVGTPYSTTIAIGGGTAPYKVSLQSGALPPGLTLAIAGSNVTISGTPTGFCSTSPCAFTILVMDSSPVALQKTIKVGAFSTLTGAGAGAK